MIRIILNYTKPLEAGMGGGGGRGTEGHFTSSQVGLPYNKSQ